MHLHCGGGDRVDIGVEERRVAIEAIATLANLKNVVAELVLRPAGVPVDVYHSRLYGRDEVTGRPLSKRKSAPLIIDAVAHRPDGVRIVRRIIEIAAQWSSFHLAADEYAARATVHKAREILGTLEQMEAWESQQREEARKAELARMEQERATLLRGQLDLLLMMFDELAQSSDHQRRGYFLQDLLTRTFDLYSLPVHRSFTRNAGGEQIDGAFQLDGWYYLVECRWRDKLADIRQLDGLWGQIGRSGRQTMGLFLSINGWSENVVPLLRQNPAKSIMLMDGYDLRAVLDGRIDLRDFLVAKVAKLNLAAEPFLGATTYLEEQSVS
jgi:hypothetical protein